MPRICSWIVPAVAALTAALGSASPAAAGTCYRETFDTYANGSLIVDQGGWRPFFGLEALGDESVVTDAESLSRPQSLRVFGNEEIVQAFAGVSSGRWVVRFHQLVPEGVGGFLGVRLFRSYDEVDEISDTAASISIDAVFDTVRSGGGGELPLRRGEWIEIRVEIDFDSDSQSTYYAGELLATTSWTGQGGRHELAAMGIWNKGAAGAFYDSITVCDGSVRNLTQGTEHTTIQSAIDAAVDTDVIEVAAGAYGETIDYLGKDVIVGGATGDADDVIVHGQGEGPVVSFVSGETMDAQLRHVTVTGGRSTGLAGGIRIVGSEAVVFACRIRGNEADTGGGISVQSGGALIDSCQVEENRTPTEGGGLRVEASHVLVTSSTFRLNHAGGGGGAWAGNGASVAFDTSVFEANTTDLDGSAVLTAFADTVLGSCLIRSNAGSGSGGSALSSRLSSSMTITNCTIVENTGTSGGGLSTFEGTSTVTNCIFWDNGPLEIEAAGGDTTVSFSDVRGGWSGPGSDNIDENPVFMDQGAGNFRLAEGTPCVDAGDDDAPSLPVEALDGIARIRNCRVDMGAYEAPFFLDCNADGVGDACNIELDTNLIDDGVAEMDLGGFYTALTFGVSYTIPSGPAQVVSAIAIAWPDDGVLAVGDEITVLLWDDPNGDGLPTDAVPLASVVSTIGHLNSTLDAVPETFDVYPIPETVLARPYFVGAAVEPGVYQAAVDTTAPVAGRNWVATGFGTDAFRDAVLAEDACEGCAGNFLVRTRRSADQDANGDPDECEVVIIFEPPREFMAEGEATREAVGNLDTTSVAGLGGFVTNDVVVLIPDADPDLPGLVQVFRNPGGDGNLVANEAIATGRDPSSVDIGLLDGDAFLDFVVANATDDTVTVYFNDGSGLGTFLPPVVVGAGDDPRALATGDFDRDGTPDIAVAFSGTSEARILFNQGDGTFVAGDPLPGGPGVPLIRPENLDNDKDLDIVETLTNDGVVLVVFLDDGVLESQQRLPVGEGPVDATTGDFDGNGFADIATADNGSNTVTLLLNDGGVFRPAVPVFVGENPLSIDAVDLDDDGDVDLAVVATDPILGRAVQVLENNTVGGDGPGRGGGLFAPLLTIGIDARPNFIASGDFNQDTRADLVTANDEGGGEGSVTVLLTADPLTQCPGDADGNGVTEFADIIVVLSAWGPCKACPEDLNRDGIVDFSDILVILSGWGPCE